MIKFPNWLLNEETFGFIAPPSHSDNKIFTDDKRVGATKCVNSFVRLPTSQHLRVVFQFAALLNGKLKGASAHLYLIKILFVLLRNWLDVIFNSIVNDHRNVIAQNIIWAPSNLFFSSIMLFIKRLRTLSKAEERDYKLHKLRITAINISGSDESESEKGPYRLDINIFFCM